MPQIILHLRRWRRAVLLFSGGLDSSLLLALGREALGEGLTALTFTGPHTTPGEVWAACQLARKMGVRHLLRDIDPLTLPDFRENTPRRCYACKQAMLAKAGRVAAALTADVLWDGTNADDLEDYRPGFRAVREAGAVSPLLEAGLGKQEIRRLSQRLGLPEDRPPQSCLATRFPYHTTLTPEALKRVGRAEAWLRSRGFTHVRLRVHDGQSRLELGAEEWQAFLTQDLKRPFLAVLNRLGFQDLELTLPG